MIIIDANTKVFYLLSNYPQLADILSSAGLDCVNTKTCRSTLSKVMTLKDAAHHHNVDFNNLKKALLKNGFIVE